MTAISNIFEHRGSRGWVILAGESPSIRGSGTLVLDLIKGLLGSEKSLVVLTPGGKIPSAAQPFIKDFEALICRDLKIIDPLDMTPALIQSACQDEQLVLALGGNHEDWATVFAEERLPADPDLIIAENSLFMAIGRSVSLLGEWTYDSDQDHVSEGIGWFPSAIFLSSSEAPASKKGIRQKIESQMNSYALSLAPETIIAIGPQGKVEIWGDAAPEILLGPGWL